jgi:hypothetical protein
VDRSRPGSPAAARALLSEVLSFSAAVPDPRNGAVDEQYRKVAGLTTGERALRGRSGEESLTRVAANGVGAEVWQ